MSTQHCRLRVKIDNFEFEVEGDSSFVLGQFRRIKLHGPLKEFIKDETEISLEARPKTEKELLEEQHQLPLQEFFNEKGRPETTAERVALIAYWLEYLADERKPIFKNKEIVNLWINTLRLSRPNTTSTLCRDAKNKGWLIPARDTKGYWQLSLQGKDFVENELPSAK